jgi:thiosulfate/3-mercaptopyruvate sulfurtransferase
MDPQVRHRKVFAWQAAFVVLCALLIPLVLNSCGTSSFDKPVTSLTTATLIPPETLKAWTSSGIVNSTGYDRVVILDVTSLATYTAGHIPGAQFLNTSDLYNVRQEGPATDVNMVLDGGHMDALIQRYGIDKNTTVVFTSGAASPGAGSVLSATRAYWTFRYWGFSKEKLKLLDGINFSWKALYGLSTASVPAPTPSTYSVKTIAALRGDLRSSLGDMINVAEGKVPNAIPIDMRSGETEGSSYTGKRGSTTGVFSPGSDFVAFEGRVKGARALLYTTMFDSANNYRFKSANVLAAMFAAIGVGPDKLAHVY